MQDRADRAISLLHLLRISMQDRADRAISLSHLLRMSIQDRVDRAISLLRLPKDSGFLGIKGCSFPM
jgi:hypothetical protein